MPVPNPKKKRATTQPPRRSAKSTVKATEFFWDANVLQQHFRITPAEFVLIKEFIGKSPAEKVKASRRIIQECVIEAIQAPDALFALALEASDELLKGYPTLDDQHRGEIEKLIKQSTAYLRDPTRKRPLNALMLAAPGAGKSHFIKQLAAKMSEDRVEAVTFNMATMQSADDMAQPIDVLRNLKVNDRFPLLFLDEFDSDPSRYASLRPLLWDGELQIGHRDLKLGKAVIVLAGSSPNLPLQVCGW
jgi:Viral (Superfamily 1) RNA helicase